VTVLSGTNAWNYEAEAIDKFNTGAYAEAVDLFYKTIELSPQDSRAFFNFSLALAKLGETYAALDMLKKGLDLDQNDKQALKLLTILFEEIKDTAENLHEMIEIAWIGRFLKDKDLLANLIDSMNFKPAIDIYFANGTDFLHAEGTKRVVNAIVAGRPPIKIQNRDFPNSYMAPLLTFCYKHISLPCLLEGAIEHIVKYIEEHYEELLESEKSVAIIWAFNQGKKKYDEAEYETAALIFEGLGIVEPTNLAILLYCGKALRDSGDMDLVNRSIDYYKRIIQLNEENALGWYDLSLSYAVLGDFRRELFCLRRAYDLGHSREDISRITYLESITAPEDPFE